MKPMPFSGRFWPLAIAAVTTLPAGGWAQERTAHAPAVYVHLGYGPLLERTKGFDFVAGITVKPVAKPVGLAVQLRYGQFHANALPADYAPGLKLFGDGIPDDRFFTAGLAGVGVWPLASRVSVLRLRLEAGPAYARFSKNAFTKNPPPSGGGFGFFFGSNYSVVEELQSGIGAEGAVRLEAADRRFGVSAGLWTHIGTALQVAGVEFVVLLGRCR